MIKLDRLKLLRFLHCLSCEAKLSSNINFAYILTLKNIPVPKLTTFINRVNTFLFLFQMKLLTVYHKSYHL